MYKVYFTQTIEDEYQRTVRASSPQDAEEKLKERWSGDIEVHNVMIFLMMNTLTQRIWGITSNPLPKTGRNKKSTNAIKIHQ